MSKINLSEKEKAIFDEMEQRLEGYRTLHDEILIKEYKNLQKEQGKLPKHYTDNNQDFEDHILAAANAKHQAIELYRSSLTAYDSISADLDYFSAQLKLYLAESFLQEHGFDRPTDSLRESFVKSNATIKDLIKVQGKLESLSGATERLVKAFENDETNCRRLLERKTKYQGL